MKLTLASLTNLKLKSGDKDRIWFDDDVPGFGLRVRDTGSRSWIYQYKIGGKTRRLVLGQATAIKLARAREIAGELHARVRLGGDPAAEKRALIERSSHSFGALAQQYLAARRSGVRPRSLPRIEHYIEVHAAPFDKLPIESIDRRAVAERLAAIERASGGVAANRVRSALSAMFTWAIKEGLAASNPVIGTYKRPEQVRDRVLSGEEVRRIWHALQIGEYGTIVKLLILTGQRANEIAALSWPEIDFKANVINLPRERTKNGRQHIIPLAATARALLAEVPVREGRELVFGKGVGPFSDWSNSKKKLDAAIAEGERPLPPWTTHDIRRTVATGMADIGIPPHIIEAVLNHVSGHKGGVAGIYNRSSYAAEKAAALARWDEHVRSIALVPGYAGEQEK
jgi:integrase